MKIYKKGAAELISIIVGIAIIGALTLAIVTFMGKKTTTTQTQQLDTVTNKAITAIKA